MLNKNQTTNILLLLIAAGLWLNAAAYLLRPASASAQGAQVENLLNRIEGDLSRIQRGTCANEKIC